jgi:DnaK suppressor protein
VTHQISAVDNHRLDPAELTILRASLHEHRLFRRQQLRDIAAETACSPGVAAHREVRRKLTAAAQSALAETEAALARMAAGRYGACGRCGRIISFHCLSAYPQARHCTRCRHLLELQR